MNRQRSFSRKKGAGTSSVSVALNSLLENVLCSLAMLKDQIEFVDDELFSLQTKSTAALPVTSQLSHLLRVSELYSFCVFSCQKKLEELSVFAGLAKVEEQVLEPRQSGGAASVPDELSEFLRHFVVGSPVFRDLVLELYPESAEMIRVLCNHESDVCRLVCSFVANYHSSDARMTLPTPNALVLGLEQRFAEHHSGVAFCVPVVEALVFPFIVLICRERTQRSSLDSVFANQFETLSKAGQSHFSIRLDLQQKGSSKPWDEAVRELQQLRFLICPRDLLDCVFRVAKHIFRSANKVDTIGGDDFMDILCFCVFKSRVKALYSIVNYLETFLGEDVDPEKMYYFTCVQLALSFIRDLDWNKLRGAQQRLAKQSRDVSKKMNVTLIAEKNQFLKRFVNVSNPQFEVVVSSLPLTGFSLYCVREWIDESTSEENHDDFRKTIVVKTDNANDSISVLAVRALGEVEFGELFFRGMRSEEIQNLELVQTRFGSLYCVPEIRSPELRQFGSLLGLKVPKGNFDDIEAAVTEFVVVRQLLWPHLQDAFHPHVSESWTHRLQLEYLSAESVKSIVREAQVLLKLLACYPRLAPLDGRLSFATANAISLFQQSFVPVEIAPKVREDGRKSIARNLFLSSGWISQPLPATGRLNPATVVAMYGALAANVERLKCNVDLDDLVFGYAQISTLVKQMQERRGIYVSGAFDEQTLALLEQ